MFRFVSSSSENPSNKLARTQSRIQGDNYRQFSVGIGKGPPQAILFWVLTWHPNARFSLYNQFFHQRFQQEYHFTDFRWFHLQRFGILWDFLSFWGFFGFFGLFRPTFLGFHRLFASRRACGAAPKNGRFSSQNCRINREIWAIISTHGKHTLKRSPLDCWA